MRGEGEGSVRGEGEGGVEEWIWRQDKYLLVFHEKVEGCLGLGDVPSCRSCG